MEHPTFSQQVSWTFFFVPFFSNKPHVVRSEIYHTWKMTETLWARFLMPVHHSLILDLTAFSCLCQWCPLKCMLLVLTWGNLNILFLEINLWWGSHMESWYYSSWMMTIGKILPCQSRREILFTAVSFVQGIAWKLLYNCSDFHFWPL